MMVEFQLLTCDKSYWGLSGMASSTTSRHKRLIVDSGTVWGLVSDSVKR